MSERRLRPTALARFALELALATFTLWLIVQNVLIVVLEPWKAPPAAIVVAGSVVKIALTVIAAVWPWLLAAAVIAAVLIAGLTRRVPVWEEVRRG